ncbi:hypothetical protein B0H10DRAFT_2239378 [Mycena sp. CBHHK59/15]|nr:hypothetical protein B0H10DRAFT_2239378 [Mycena sp. CBHHK59/15]
MHFLNVAVLALLPLIQTVLSVPTRRDETSRNHLKHLQTAPSSPPGAAFDFRYNTMADYGVTSYNYSVWLLTSMPTTFAQSTDFAEGHSSGALQSQTTLVCVSVVSLILMAEFRIRQPVTQNPAPAQLIMPDFSKNPVVMEEYANGSGSVGSRLALAVNSIVYNGTTS